MSAYGVERCQVVLCSACSISAEPKVDKLIPEASGTGGTSGTSEVLG